MARGWFSGRGLFASICGLAAMALLEACAPHGAAAPGGAGAHLQAFRSDDDLRAFLRRRPIRQREYETANALPSAAPADAAAPAAAPPASEPQSITNTQEAGVDEGDIVKARGDLLIILRRGRLYTLSTAGAALQPVDAIDAFPPGVDPQGDWYDEMLITADRVIVIGYSYSRGGTQIDRFRLNEQGRLTFEDCYQLRSNDYYSADNYASRLIGTRLVFYSPLNLGYGRGDPLQGMPALRRWKAEGDHGQFRRIASARQVYIPPALLQDPTPEIDALHTVTTCDLEAPVLDCSAVGVLGPSARTFYVSQKAVYLWVSRYDYRPDGAPSRRPNAMVYRLPFDGSAPSAVAARGAPTNQFSFREDAAGDELEVLLRAEAGGDAMWRREWTEGGVALARIPMAAFGDGSRELEAEQYRVLPKAEGQTGSFENRFVGAYVLYGVGAGWDTPQAGSGVLYAVPVAGGAVAKLAIPQTVDRIEPMGANAVVIGTARDGLGFSAVELGGGTARLGDRYLQPSASQGETRSHGFFFKAEGPGGDGVIGLPVARPARPAYRQLFESSAAMVFLRREAGRFAPLGALEANSDAVVDDGCKASCVDWYGNARPIFLGGRTYALMGYELVEGRLSRSAIAEARRLNFAPAVRQVSR